MNLAPDLLTLAAQALVVPAFGVSAEGQSTRLREQGQVNLDLLPCS